MASIHKRSTATGTRYDVRYRLRSGQTRTKTCRTRKDANAFAATVEADKARGGLIDPRAGRVTLASYAGTWLDHRPQLRARTVVEYRGVLGRHILPPLGAFELSRLDVATVRAWHARLLRDGVGSPTVAKCYRVLRAVLATAVEDGLILTNPCQVKGAGIEHSPERPVVGPQSVWALADAVPPPRRCLVLLGGFCGLRLGEALGLQVRHLDLLHAVVTVERQSQEVEGRQVFSDPKTAAGRRRIPLPASVASELERHLDRWAGPGADGLLFVGVKGGPLRRHVFSAEFRAARVATGMPDVRYHDLRHSALTMLAATGATVAELQAHAGHASPVAALRYQHATEARARELAALIDRVISAPPQRITAAMAAGVADHSQTHRDRWATRSVASRNLPSGTE